MRSVLDMLMEKGYLSKCEYYLKSESPHIYITYSNGSGAGIILEEFSPRENQD